MHFSFPISPSKDACSVDMQSAFHVVSEGGFTKYDTWISISLTSEISLLNVSLLDQCHIL